MTWLRSPLALLVVVFALCAGLFTAPSPAYAASSKSWVPQLGNQSYPVAYPSCRPIRVRVSFEAMKDSNISPKPYLSAIKSALKTISAASGYDIQLIGKASLGFYVGEYEPVPQKFSGRSAEITVFYNHPSSPKARQPFYGGTFQYYAYSTGMSVKYPKEYLAVSGVNANVFQQSAYAAKYGKQYLRHVTLKSLLLAMGLGYNSFPGSLLNYDSFNSTKLSAGDVAGLKALFKAGSCTKNPPPPLTPM